LALQTSPPPQLHRKIFHPNLHPRSGSPLSPLSSRSELRRSVSATTLNGSAAPPLSSLRSSEGAHQQPHSMEAQPSPLSSRPELRRSVVERSAVQRSFPGNVFRQSVRGFPTSRCRQRPRVRLSLKRAACRPSNPRVYTGNPGKRSGGTCGSAVLYWKCFQPSMPDTNPSRTTVPPQEPAIALRGCYDV
jgi:hypothetical protein